LKCTVTESVSKLPAKSVSQLFACWGRFETISISFISSILPVIPEFTHFTITSWIRLLLLSHFVDWYSLRKTDLLAVVSVESTLLTNFSKCWKKRLKIRMERITWLEQTDLNEGERMKKGENCWNHVIREPITIERRSVTCGDMKLSINFEFG
jgi:hypothetical protein